MKILAVADFHGKCSADTNLAKFLERDDYDILIMLGDLTHLGPDSELEDILERVKTSKIKTLAVPGNCDPRPIQQILEKHGISLHRKKEDYGGTTFVGLGGSNTTPFNTPFELTESEIEEDLDSVSNGVKNGWILVTHVPPYGTCADLTPDGIHVGSKAVRKIIDRKQPRLSLCAHIHEARCTDKIGDTVIVNPGPISKGFAAAITIDKSAKVELLEI